MKSTIEQTQDGLRIEAEIPEGQREAWLKELGKCAGGTCSCPTPQYDKLSAIDVKTTDAGVAVSLVVKPGETVDVDDIQRCLAHTARSVGA